MAGWLAELGRQVVDVPGLLESPHAVERLGQALIADLPRMWLGRLEPVLVRLRMGGGKGRRSGGLEEPVGELLPSFEWPEGENWQPQFVTAAADGYRVVLPFEASAAELLAGRKELLYFILRDLGPDAARMHLVLTGAGPGEVDGAALVAGLGVTGRQRPRQEHADRCRAAVAALGAVGVAVLRWDLADGILTYEHSEHPLWSLKLREYGQTVFVEQDGALLTRGEQWAVLPGPESWAPALPDTGLVGHMALFSSIILEDLQGGRDPLSLAIAVLLAFGSRLSVGGPLAVPNRHIVRLADLTGLMASTDGVQPLIQSIRKAARLQRKWGWAPDFSDWPREAEAFLQATTLFHFDAEVAVT
ncbi:MAG: Helix-turn-helix domain protein [Firmicutes bacterium]|nr:Helix-turn-helix domain protein [Bacillota bacterium]